MTQKVRLKLRKLEKLTTLYLVHF